MTDPSKDTVVVPGRHTREGQGLFARNDPPTIEEMLHLSREPAGERPGADGGTAA